MKVNFDVCAQDENDDDKESIELETTRSGRIRKKKRLMQFLDEEEDDSSLDEEDRDEYRPESEAGIKILIKIKISIFY